MLPKILILAGAPKNDALDWDPDGLLDKFLEPVARFAGLIKPLESHAAAPIGETSVLDIATWRSIPLERARLRTGFSQVHEFEGEYHGDRDFFTSLTPSQRESQESMGSNDDNSSLLSQFYQHSLAVHDEIPSSQLPPSTYSTTGASFSTNNDESMDESTVNESTILKADRTLGLGSSHLSDLEDLPRASYLKSIEPQTMTVNLIAGVISIAEPRSVMTRWGKTMSLVELLVGDETRSGFSITFWLSPESRTNTSIMLRNMRRQDIILLRNVGLSQFKDKVHGHSLRKDLTRIDLLYRRKLEEDDIGGFYSAKDLSSRRVGHPQLTKARKVREWVLHFVGGRETRLGKRKEKERAIRSWELPPDDTQ